MACTRPEKITDIVWLATGFIGDVVLLTAGTELAAKEFPGVRQHVVTTPVGKKALVHANQIASTAVFEKRSKGTLSAFRAVKSQLAAADVPKDGTVVLAAHRSFRSMLLCRYLGYYTVAYTEADLGWLAQRRVDRIAVLHEAARISLLLEPLGVDRSLIRVAKPKLSPSPLRSEVRSLLPQNEDSLVAIAPGSVWGTKRWTTEGFIAVTQSLLSKGHAVVLIGSHAEESVAREIEAACSAPGRLLNLAGKTNIEDLPALLALCRVLISNDSSPIHFASAVNTPTVGVFGATVPEMGFGPLADGSLTAGITLSCRPCSDHGPMVCPLGHFRCMKDLKPESVLSLANHLLT